MGSVSGSNQDCGSSTPELLIRRSTLVFWDFDGVIKESLEVKALAFESLFAPYGAQIASRVRAHHGAHTGVSRFEKMPIYLDWAGQPVTPARVQEYCARFGETVRQAVIDAPWVPGVERVLRTRRPGQSYVLISATPQPEIEEIVNQLALTRCFAAVYGSPTPKAVAVERAMAALGSGPESCLLVGDSETDLEAARVTQVPFLLRRTPMNRALQDYHRGPAFEALVDE